MKKKLFKKTLTISVFFIIIIVIIIYDVFRTMWYLKHERCEFMNFFP